MRPKTTAKVIALGLATTIVLTACGSSDSGDPNKVVYWDTSGSNEHSVFAELAEGCGQRGGYQVTVESVPFDQALNNFKTAAQGGQGPDVLRADVGWVAQLAQSGLIKDLSGTPLAADASGYLPVPLESTRHEGKTYAVPQVTDSLALFYNKRKLAEAGVTPPKTWEELRQIAPKLGGDKALFLNNDAYYSLPFLYGEGGDIVDARARSITVNSPESVRGMRTAKALLDDKAAQTSLDPTNSNSNMKAAFSSGQVAMIIDGPWVTGDLFASGEFADRSNLGIAAIPGPANATPVGGHDYVLRQGSDSTEASAKFIECMSSAETQSVVAQKLGLLPTRRSVYQDPAVRQQPVVSAFSTLVENAHTRAWIPEGNELLEPLKTTYADILAGRKEAQAALDDLAKTYKDTVVTQYSQR